MKKSFRLFINKNLFIQFREYSIMAVEVPAPAICQGTVERRKPTKSWRWNSRYETKLDTYRSPHMDRFVKSSRLR
jgi:hypothetical protein